MRWTDILGTSLANLTRRKLRSVLTLLGVVIGTAAIIVTISLGKGAEATQMQAMQESENLRLVNVSPHYGGGITDATTEDSGRRITKINDAVLNHIRKIDNVDAVTPLLNLYLPANFELSTGKYIKDYNNLVAVYPNDFMKIINLDQGKGFTSSANQMEFIMAETQILEFRDPKTSSANEWIDTWAYFEAGKELPLLDIDWLNSRYTLKMTSYDYENVSETQPEPVETVKEYKAKMVGILKSTMTSFDFDYSTYINIDWAKKLLKENKELAKQSDIKSLDDYQQVYVLAKDVDDVTQIVKDLKELGVQCYSPLEWVDMMKKQIQTTQTFLGLIGVVAMLVAALSIANTMMMSIYERTREIGVMKVLGCKMTNIRLMFLIEAAYIGLFGGGAGLIVSFLISYGLNNIPWLQEMIASIMGGGASMGGTTSLITPGLALGTWVGVTAVSVLSGLHPANKAMKLSSLAAIRNAD